MDLSFTRGDEIEREQRTVSAEMYNKIRLLFSRSGGDNLFIPIRSMQYLAIVDDEEIVFVDGQGPREIELAWRDFHPGARENLRAPVAYTCVFYRETGRDIMGRLHSEFMTALELLEEKRRPAAGAATVTPLDKS